MRTRLAPAAVADIETDPAASDVDGGGGAADKATPMPAADAGATVAVVHETKVDDQVGEEQEAAAAAAGTAGVECPSARPRLSFISRSRASGCIAAYGSCSAADIQAPLGAMSMVLGVDAGVAIWLTAPRNPLPAGGRTTEEWDC